MQEEQTLPERIRMLHVHCLSCLISGSRREVDEKSGLVFLTDVLGQPFGATDGLSLNVGTELPTWCVIAQKSAGLIVYLVRLVRINAKSAYLNDHSSVSRSSCISASPTERIYIKFHFRNFYEKLLIISKYAKNRALYMETVPHSTVDVDIKLSYKRCL